VAVVQYTYTINNTQNDTKQTIHRTTSKLGRVRADLTDQTTDFGYRGNISPVSLNKNAN